jgi:hypothetical protein
MCLSFKETLSLPLPLTTLTVETTELQLQTLYKTSYVALTFLDVDACGAAGRFFFTALHFRKK